MATELLRILSPLAALPRGSISSESGPGVGPRLVLRPSPDRAAAESLGRTDARARLPDRAPWPGSIIANCIRRLRRRRWRSSLRTWAPLSGGLDALAGGLHLVY